jgi:hypothetical protein
MTDPVAPIPNFATLNPEFPARSGRARLGVGVNRPARLCSFRKPWRNRRGGETRAHLWAERFDRDTDDLFALQNEITRRIAVAVNLELTSAEAVRPTEHSDAVDYILRGRVAGLKPPLRDSRTEAISLFERAAALDTRSIEAQYRLAIAFALTARVLDNMTGSAGADLARAKELAEQALATSLRGPLGLKKPAAPSRRTRTLVPASPLPMPSKARLNAPPPNSPKLGG